MGLDIFVITDNYDVLQNAYFSGDECELRSAHRLSRTFCNFMCRPNVISHEPELDQIGRIAGVNIAPLTEMNSYPDELDLEYWIGQAETEEERQKIINKAETAKASLRDNIDRISETINALTEKISNIRNLPELLQPTDFDSLNNATYFAHLQIDNIDRFAGDNFGQDLRNFRRVLEFAKAHGSTPVWFSYG